MKTLTVLFLLTLIGCSEKRFNGPDWCIDECAKIKHEFKSYNPTDGCTCGPQIKKECE